MEWFRLFAVLFLIVDNILIIKGQGLLGAVENILGLDDSPQNVNNRYTATNANTNTNNPIRNNLLAPNRNPLNSQFTNYNNNNKHHGLFNPTSSLNREDSTKIHNSVLQKVNQGNYEDDDVKLAAQQFPSLQKLLERLKELNKQKEQQGQSTTTTTTMITPQKDPNEETPKEKKKLKVMRRKKFYFQVTPVVPDNERKELVSETVYYEE